MSSLAVILSPGVRLTVKLYLLYFYCIMLFFVCGSWSWSLVVFFIILSCFVMSRLHTWTDLCRSNVKRNVVGNTNNGQRFILNTNRYQLCLLYTYAFLYAPYVWRCKMVYNRVFAFQLELFTCHDVHPSSLPRRYIDYLNLMCIKLRGDPHVF